MMIGQTLWLGIFHQQGTGRWASAAAVVLLLLLAGAVDVL